jgi:hypothetical protein
MYGVYGNKGSECKLLGQFKNPIDAKEFKAAVENNTKNIKVNCQIVEL